MLRWLHVPSLHSRHPQSPPLSLTHTEAYAHAPCTHKKADTYKLLHEGLSTGLSSNVKFSGPSHTSLLSCLPCLPLISENLFYLSAAIHIHPSLFPPLSSGLLTLIFCEIAAVASCWVPQFSWFIHVPPHLIHNYQIFLLEHNLDHVRPLP